jgi:hypothetical protein
VTTWPKPEAKKTAAPKPPQPAALSPEASAAHLPITHVPAAEPPPPPVTIPTAKWPLPGPTEKVEVQASAVTITGCLALDDEGFRLKDTDGVDAPKSRSWKSGFLTRRPAAVELLDPGNTVKLSTYVGHRVAATGTLTDREMQVRSVRRVTTAPCS